MPATSGFEVLVEPSTAPSSTGASAAATSPASPIMPGPRSAPISVGPIAPDADGPSARIHWIGSFVHDRHPADLYAEMLEERGDLVVVDARYREAFDREHIPGAVNMPWREIDETTTAHLRRDVLYVVYCWNASCHASTKTATRLRALGFQVKELHGGLETWRKQGYPTECD
jgi:rhodanese-related sulfurtransferase